MVMRNLDVITSFLGHRSCQWPLNTDGGSLFSYGIEIARWSGDEIIMPDSFTFHSITTSRHRNQVRQVGRNRRIKVVEI